MSDRARPAEHAFVGAPHRTLVRLALPVLLSLVAEPLTGLADTAFVARLGATPLAALGVAVMLLSSLFWVFNFLGIGTQTAVAQAAGRGDFAGARAVGASATVTAVGLGVAVGIVVWPWLPRLASFMGADASMAAGAVSYLRIRLFGAPAILVLLASFGVLRGRQDMKTPFRIAVMLNLLNVVLDYLLIFGVEPLPALGLSGAAWATVASQCLGGLWAWKAARDALGGGATIRARDVGALLVVGRDLAARTALLLAFLLLATRAATRIGAAEGAAQQAVRQTWMLAAFVLDAFAASAQSLVGFFVGAGELAVARRVARVALLWATAAGIVLSAVLEAAEESVSWLLVPADARIAFASVWGVAAAAQPINAVAFVTDGIHWGTGDYRFLRNVMLLASAGGAILLAAVDLGAADSFWWIWVVTDSWIAVRAAFGVARVWPGLGRAPLRRVDPQPSPA